MNPVRRAALLPVLLAAGSAVPCPAAAGDASRARIGPYEVCGVLGRGGMGTVYLAEQRVPQRRRVALKVLAADQRERWREQFDVERRALAAASHDNVVALLDDGVAADGRAYLAMELVAGEPITAYCDRRRLGVRARAELLAQVCDGVQHLHERGVLHRDLKPDNVLVTERAGRPVVKILDLGLAALAADGGPRSELVGTPGYMAPEQAGLQPAPDARADVFALGALCYELIAGVTPVSSAELRHGDVLALQRRIADQDPPAPRERLRGIAELAASIAAARGTSPAGLARELRGPLADVAMRALARDRQVRQQSAAELAAELRAAAIRPSWALAAVAAATALLGSAGGWLAGWLG